MAERTGLGDRMFLPPKNGKMWKIALLVTFLTCAFLAWRFIIYKPVTFPELPPPNIFVEPNYQSGFPGENLLYTVTVINYGNVPDNYVLTVEDNLGWVLALFDDFFQIPPDEIRHTTLKVAIPENAIPSTEDQIIITASSQTRNISWSRIFYAHVILPKDRT